MDYRIWCHELHPSFDLERVLEKAEKENTEMQKPF